MTQILSDFYETEGLKNDSIKKRVETFFLHCLKKAQNSTQNITCEMSSVELSDEERPHSLDCMYCAEAR